MFIRERYVATRGIRSVRLRFRLIAKTVQQLIDSFLFCHFSFWRPCSFLLSAASDSGGVRKSRNDVTRTSAPLQGKNTISCANEWNSVFVWGFDSYDRFRFRFLIVNVQARAQVHNAELSSGLYFTALEAARGWDRTVYSHCGWTRHAMGIMNFPMEQERSCGAPDPNAKCKCLTMNANKKVKDKHASHNAGLQQRHMDGAMSAQGIVGALPDGALSHPSMAFDRRGMDMRSFDLNAGFPIMNMSAPAPQFHSAFGAASMNMSSYYMPMTYPMASRTESSAAGLVPTSIDLPAGSDASLGTVNMEAMATMPEPLPSLYSGMHVQSY
jgi:hypothetical protein